MIRQNYIDDNGSLTDVYYTDKENGSLKFAETVADSADFNKIIDTIYDVKAIAPEDARKENVELRLNKDKLDMKEFKELWSKINSKSYYVVDFNTEELIKNCVNSLNKKLIVSKIYFKIEKGAMNTINSKDSLLRGDAFQIEETKIPSLLRSFQLTQILNMI